MAVAKRKAMREAAPSIIVITVLAGFILNDDQASHAGEHPLGVRLRLPHSGTRLFRPGHLMLLGRFGFSSNSSSG